MQRKPNTTIADVRKKIKSDMVAGLRKAIAETGSDVIQMALFKVMKMILTAKKDKKSHDVITYELALLGLMEVIEELETATANN